MNQLSNHAHWLLRIAIASVFLFHGLTKFPELAGFAQMMGLPLIVALAVALAEVIGAGLILAGGLGPAWFTRLGSILLIPIMLGAIVKVHWGQWSFVPSSTHPMGGFEFQAFIVLILGYLLFSRVSQKTN